MKKTIYKEENYIMSKWSGGNTRELAIYPEKAEYLDRDFIWRLSSADSDLEESSFTKLPDYDRILMVLEGEVVLAHGEERSVSLKAMEQDTFSGATKTKCFGQLKKDYNLIYRKGTKGRMELIEIGSEAKQISLSDNESADSEGFGGEYRSYGVYVIEGYAVVTAGGNSDMVKADQQMVINCSPNEEMAISVMGQGTCIFTEVVYENQVASFEAAVENAEPVSGGKNFGLALKLFLSNNRWSALMRREKKTGYFYSPDLERGLRKIDKYYITAIVWVLGIMICLFGLKLGMSSSGVAIAMLIYTIIDFLVISPLIYLAMLPKPLAAHVKDTSNLTPAELEAFYKQAGYDPHQERLMYKYRKRDIDEKMTLKEFIGKSKK